MESPETGPKAQLAERARLVLRAFLDSGSRLAVDEAAEPAVSVILVLFNRAELTLRCLRSVAESRVPLEVVIVDNASSDETPALLRRIAGARVVVNGENRGFLRAVNQAARRCRGRHLLLLNNDAELLPGSLEAAIETLESGRDVGAVGGRLVLPDGTLQEAGSIVWNDGSCLGYGRGQAPDRPEFMFRRDVDYCSGAFLLTPRALFEELGGFDEDFAPAYYEEADYCLRLWRTGRRVVYEPRATVLHHEFASSPSMAHAVRMQAERRALFVRKHAAELAAQQPPAVERVLAARTRGRAQGGARVLVLDDRVPHDALGAGFPRARRLLETLLSLGHETTLFPLSPAEEGWSEVYADLPRTLEVVKHPGVAGLGPFLAERRGHHDLVLVSRPHNMLRLRAALAADATLLDGVALVYDAEALFALRDVAGRRLRGEAVPASEEAALVRQEVALASAADVVFAVSEAERARFVEGGHGDVRVLGHALQTAQTAPLGGRDGLLFVGAVHGDDDPNADALTWLVQDVLPALASRCDRQPQLRVAGLMRSARVARLSRPGVQWLGPVADLEPVYAAARVFVAPTRFAAGIPHKVHHAVAHGLPVVATSLLARQLGWEAGRELLVADDAGGFAEACARLLAEGGLWQSVREAADRRLQREASPAQFASTLGAGLEAALARARDRRHGH